MEAEKSSDFLLPAEFFPEFAAKFDEIDSIYAEKRSIDEKTYQFICLALSIKNRSAPCVKKHFMGALKAGATLKEIAYIMALTFRESGGSDDCWVHDVLADYMRKTTFKTVVGDVKFGAKGEWAEDRMLLVQFQNIKSNSLDEFRDLSTEVILDPPQYKSGNLIYPYGEAKK